MSGGLGMDAGRGAKVAAERRRRSAMVRLANDALLGVDEFRDFLAKVADRAGYFRAEGQASDWCAGYRAALRDLVNGVVMNSSSGAAWLQDYAAGMAERNNEKEKDDGKQ